MREFSPDIICFQETKAHWSQIPASIQQIFSEYYQYWHSASRAGYSGTAIFSKIPAKNYTVNFPTSLLQPYSSLQDAFGDLLTEGRLQTLEFDHFFLVNVYTPNSKQALERLNLRHQVWDPLFRAYLAYLAQQKPVITCGDFNAAHQEIDLARPKSNHHHAGFTDEERQGITNLLATNFIDTFRALHPDSIRYTWWSHFGQARAKNVGWRIDYFFISANLLSNLLKAEIHDSRLGSDHCPISITINQALPS